MQFLDYTRINAEQFPRLLELFAYAPEAAALQAMREQFKYDSKQPQALSSFKQDSTSKQAAVTPAIRDACEQWLAKPMRAMQDSDRNLVI